MESDILTEMALPPSGIQAVEHILQLPYGFDENEWYAGLLDESQRLLHFYRSKLVLRRKLNLIYRQIYH